MTPTPTDAQIEAIRERHERDVADLNLLGTHKSRYLKEGWLDVHQDRATLLSAYDAGLDRPRWQGIESAPKTGDDLIEKCIIGYCADEEHQNDRMKVVWWEPKIKGGVWWSDADMECKPTHWQPLHTPPTEPSHG